MEHLENDMDDLFRKAGELYPLRTDGSDWDAVLGKLNTEGSVETGQSSTFVTGRRRIKRFMLLLIPLGLTGLIFMMNSTREKHPALNGTDAVSPAKSEPGGLANASGTEHASSVPDLPDAQKDISGTTAEPQKNSLKTQDPASGANAVALNPSGMSGEGTRTGAGHDVLMNRKNSSHKPDPGIFSDEAPDVVQGAASYPGSVREPAVLFSLLEPEIRSYSPSVYGSPLSIKPSDVSAMKVSNQGPADMPSKKNNLSHTGSPKGFYVGFAAGPDLSMVHFQSVEQPGFSLGATVGYRFSSRWAVETGFFWDKKYYYSSGQYFNKSKTSIPSNVDVNWLNGNCNMFEIPVNLRYDFARQARHGFFAKAGFSSYIMKKEDYSYQAEYAGGGNPWTGNVSYPNSTNNFISIFQLSGGYQFAIGAKTQISFEPYVKIPIQGIGIGDMPISSAGIYFGIVHSFR
jgi:hypothetical protein